jgi:6 kDa early secretory antigenic target
MTTDFSVTPEALRTASASLAAESRHLDEVLAGLTQRVNVLQANWDGAAQQAYAQAQRDWSTALDDMRAILGSISTATADIAEGYVTDDKNSAARFTHQG